MDSNINFRRKFIWLQKHRSITHGHILTEWPGLADERHFFAGYLPARLITLSRSGKSF